MRISKSEETVLQHRAAENCLWCSGKGMVAVPDMKLIESLGTIYEIEKRGYIAGLPKIMVSCPICFPEGMKVGERKRMTTLSRYSDKTYECYPREYWQLLGTSLFLDLSMRHGREAALQEICTRVRGFREEFFLPEIIRQTTVRHPINFTPKTFGKKDWRAIENKRAEARAVLDRILGEAGV